MSTLNPDNKAAENTHEAQEKMRIVPVEPEVFRKSTSRYMDIFIPAMNYPSSARIVHRRWGLDTYEPEFLAYECRITQDSALPDHSSAKEHTVGITYGFRPAAHQWWRLTISRSLENKGVLTPENQEILNDFFELAEIHVHPDYQSRGYGRALITELLNSINAPWVVLSTPEVPQEANAPFHLYRSLGFKDMVRNFYFPTDPRPFAILALNMEEYRNSDS